ncbi:MAG: hypothetical protein ACYTFY_20925 [Planctomycetota bacterium]|jgi:hypothetical protein
MEMKTNDFARAVVFGLTCECPFDIDSKSCPVRDARGPDNKESYRIVEKMPDSEIDRIYMEHRRCSLAFNCERPLDDVSEVSI